MKVVFLDIDGVLNTSQTFIDIYNEYIKTGTKRIAIDLYRLGLLKRIVDQTGSVIVLTSSWRHLGKMEDGRYIPLNDKMVAFLKLLNDYGLAIYDITPKDINGNRQNEIITWLKDKRVDSFVIIDDSSFDLPKFLNKELIKTNFYSAKESKEDSGLCECHVKEAIKKLTRN